MPELVAPLATPEESDAIWVRLMLDDIPLVEFMKILFFNVNLWREYQYAASLIEILKPQRLKEQQIRERVVSMVRHMLQPRLDEKTKEMLKRVSIERTEPFFINLTMAVPSLSVGFAATPTVMLERGTTPTGAVAQMKKLYSEELVQLVVNRLRSEPHNGIGKVWKVMLSQRRGGVWQVSVVESTLQELAAHQLKRKLKK